MIIYKEVHFCFFFYKSQLKVLLRQSSRATLPQRMSCWAWRKLPGVGGGTLWWKGGSMEGEEIKTTFQRQKQTPTQTDNIGTLSWRGRFMVGGQRLCPGWPSPQRERRRTGRDKQKELSVKIRILFWKYHTRNAKKLCNFLAFLSYH